MCVPQLPRYSLRFSATDEVAPDGAAGACRLASSRKKRKRSRLLTELDPGSAAASGRRWLAVATDRFKTSFRRCRAAGPIRADCSAARSAEASSLLTRVLE